MKILLLTLLTLSTCHTYPPAKASLYGLQEDFTDFLRLIPTYDMIQLYKNLSNQKHIVKAFAYFRSADFSAAVEALSQLPELKEAVSFMEQSGMPLPKLLKETAARLGYEFWNAEEINAEKTDLTMHDFLEDAEKLLDTWEIESELQMKYLNSKDYRTLVKIMREIDVDSLANSASHDFKIAKVYLKLSLLKVDPKELANFVQTIFVGHYFD